MPRPALLPSAGIESHPDLKLFARWIPAILKRRFPNTP
ncbi:hypothetical protein M2275_000197 [Rhodococcus opacus]|nr:hypothetical protein [Rhodococcus opacus]